MAWPDSDYPGGIDAPSDPDSTLDGTPLHSDLHLFAHSAIEKIETELGTNPSGSSATVAARFTAAESDITAIEAEIARDGCGLTFTGGSFGNDALSTVVWSTELFDDSGYHGPSTATLAFADGGFYIVTARFVRASGSWSTGYMQFALSSGGTYNSGPANTGVISLTALLYVTGGTTIQVKGYHNSGGTVSVDGTCYIARLPHL